jgi:murein DD-endopeptidase MepM/ murein hydrolase activator NlpD
VSEAQPPQAAPARRKSLLSQTWLAILTWGIAVLMLAVMVLLLLARGLVPGMVSASAAPKATLEPAAAPTQAVQPGRTSLPAFSQVVDVASVFRRTDIHTIIPTRPRTEVETYIVQKGDSVFSIANKFKLKPESILWANYDQLNDNPDMLKPGITLNIPAIDGVYYKWVEGDSIEMVAVRFKVKVEDIIDWPANKMDLTKPAVEAGKFVMVPGGKREFKQWIVPTIPRGKAGVVKTVLGAGSCDTGDGGAYGTGSFVWPAANHVLSGNDYWSGHLGIDIAAGEGAAIFAADAGVVVYSGWSEYGYGYMIMIDHGNGYQTLYAHMSVLKAVCGQSVGRGAVIGAAGNTGNSFGAHLHFELRYLGGFVNPWSVLP